MRNTFVLIACVLVLFFIALSQSTNSSSLHGGTIDSSVAANLPSVCVVGQLWNETNATSGQNLFLCTAANTWTQQSGGAAMVTSAAALPSGDCVIGGGSQSVSASSLCSLTNGSLALGVNTVAGGSVQLNGATGGSFAISVATSGSVGKLGSGISITSTNGILQNTGAVPTLTGTCTTGTVTGGAVAGSFSVTASGCTAGTIIFTFSTGATHNWVCNLLDFTTSADTFKMTATSAAACTMTGTAVNADVMYFTATPF